MISSFYARNWCNCGYLCLQGQAHKRMGLKVTNVQGEKKNTQLKVGNSTTPLNRSTFTTINKTSRLEYNNTGHKHKRDDLWQLQREKNHFAMRIISEKHQLVSCALWMRDYNTMQWRWLLICCWFDDHVSRLLKFRVVAWYVRTSRPTPIPTPRQMPRPMPTPTLTPALNQESSPSSFSMYSALE